MEKKDIKKDILYVGEEYFDRVNAICSPLSIKQITNYKDLQKHMENLNSIYMVALECASCIRPKAEKAFLPLLILSEPDIHEEGKSITSVPCGPLIVMSFNENYVLPKGYLVVDDEKYERKEGSPKNVCEEHNIPIIKASELESKLKTIIEEIFSINSKLE